MEGSGECVVLGRHRVDGQVPMSVTARRENRLWTGPEEELLRRFYPAYPAKVLEKALPRSHEAIHRFAVRHGIAGRHKTWKVDKQLFWTEWQAFVLARLRSWLASESGLEIEQVMRLILVPALRRSCEQCEFTSVCRTEDYAPCESVSVGRWLTAPKVSILSRRLQSGSEMV